MQLPAITHKTFIKKPVDDVYRAITTAEGWNSWFTDEATVDLDEKYIRLVWHDFGPDHLSSEDGGPITEAVENKRFSFQWKPITTFTTVVFELEESLGGTVLQVTEDGYKSEDIKTYVTLAVGWGEALTLLKYYLETGSKAQLN